LTSFLIGLVILALAMLSAIEVIQALLFSAHMVQHLLITMVGPPLLVLGNPLPILMWGLPSSLRHTVGKLLAPKASFRRIVRALTQPWIVWALYVGSLWLWHVPGAYDAALRFEVLHVAEHILFFGTALLFWWHIIHLPPRWHGRLSYGFRIGYVLAALIPNEILGVTISLINEPIYTYYISAPRPFNISVLDDQMLGGAIMWVPGGMMYVIAAVALLAHLMAEEERRTMQEIEEQLKLAEEKEKAG
jgi:cytochrome c oxidase assembly factor CtaG